jgi:hypothetical protein
MPIQHNAEQLLTKVAKSLTLLAIGVPGRWTGARVIAALRKAGAVSRSTAQRFRPQSDVEKVAFRGLLAAQIIRQPEPGRYYVDEQALDDWIGWPRSR